MTAATNTRRAPGGLQAVFIDLFMAALSMGLSWLLHTWLATPGLTRMLPYLFGHAVLTMAAWRLFRLGEYRFDSGLRAITLKMVTAMSALVVPLWTATMLFEVGGIGDRHSPLHGTALEPVAIVVSLLVCLPYPLLLLGHILRPRPGRWDDDRAVARTVRSAAVGVDLFLLLATAWLDALDKIHMGKDAWLTALLVVFPLFLIVALPRIALLATRFDRRAMVSLSLFILLQVLQTAW